MAEHDTPAAPDAKTSPAAPRGWVRAVGHTLRGIGWIGHWLPGAALALLLAGGVAGWVWSGSEGSLARALGWAQAWVDDASSPRGQLQASGAQGSLRQGGQVQQLRWTRPGLDVQLQGLRLRWTADQLTDALLGRGLQIDTLHLDSVQVTDTREPTPSQPLTTLVLPLAVDLPWSVDHLRIEGRQTLALDGARGHYRYGPADAADRSAWGAQHSGVQDAHHLRIDALTLAQGRYQLQAVLGAQAPMPLHASAQGDVLTTVPGGNSLSLQATAGASGTLAGQSATLDLNAQVHDRNTGPGTPTLVASARVHPWAPQPLHTVDARAHQLDLATLWPRAPVTALSGTVQASPDGGAWRATVDLRNGASGPWDRQRLPLDRLQATIEHPGAAWSVPRLQAALGRAQLQGSGRFQPAGAGAPAQWQGQLQASALNPAQLWSPLAAAALDLSASARQHPTQTGTIDLDAQLQPARGVPAPAATAGLRLRELRLQGQWQAGTGPQDGGTLRLDDALLDAAQARLTAQGTVDLTASTFNGSTTLQLPGAQGRWAGTLAHADGQGDLNLRVDAVDTLLDWARGLQDLPVLGPRLRDALAQRPALRDLRLTGQASLQAQWRGGLAELGYPAPRSGARTAVPLQLQATLDVPQLGSPSQTSTGSPTVTTPGWALRGVQLQASGRLADLAMQLRGDASQGPWSVALQTQGRAQHLWPLPGPGGEPGRLSLDPFNLRASDARQPARVVDWSLRSLQAATVSWRQTPAGLALQSGPAQWQLQPTQRGGAAGTALAPVTLAWDQLAWQAGALQTRGRLGGLPLSWMDQLARAESNASGPVTRAGLGGDLVFDGDWDLLLPLQGNDPLRLSAQLQRRSGDLILLAETDAASAPAGNAQRLPAGIRSASLNLGAQGRSVTARLRWDSERLGQASADLGTELASTPATDGALIDRWWPASAPLSGTLSARLPQVGVWSTLAPPGWRMRGTLQADATLGGTRAQPNWRGTLQADQLALRSVVDGFEFTQGQLRASLDGERLTINRFDLQGPLGGALSATGQAQWRLVDGRRQPLIDLQLRANQLRVSNRADRRLTLSGQVAAQLAGAQLNIRGQLKADSALFVLPDETTPTLSTDVVVRGGRNLQAVTSTVAQVQPDVSVQLDLGPQFDVRGRGLQARLTGQLNLRSTVALPAPRVFGEVRTASGSYRAYGQQLTIENGELVFNGPYDDPALDILAIRPMGRNTEQRVGVQINGSAQAPRVRLVATPDLPDSEKLAWLVLGRPATGAGAEAAVLQQAALALLAGNDGALNGGLAQALGLDEISYRGEATNADGSTSAAAVTLGKRISNQLYLSYETGLGGAMGTVSMFYDVSRRLTLRARAGEENALDLIFTLHYD
ncbi:MAG: translocation/assembly module TamB domain-containing protein [Hydrogenophaga sp.]|uniref:translocation/assembly module TamB domain-containing protein n=1 Tax=Hydrogenophaga sp. TaxID=1904254 RepID=UPI003D9B8CB3